MSLETRFFGVRRARPAFTLIEVLVVVAIIALLVGILLPSLRNARIQSRRTQCLSNLHQLGVGIATYMGDYKGNPPQWRVDPSETSTDGVALWQGGVAPNGWPTRLGMLYPRYVGRQENVFYCPDGAEHPLLGKDGSRSVRVTYPWSNWGKDWTYGSYEYRPRYWLNGSSTSGAFVWIGIYRDFRRGIPSIAADGFSGPWHTFGGPYPVHSPINSAPKMLYYNVAYVDGSARAVKDSLRPSVTSPGAKEFGSRAGPLAQSNPYTASRSTAAGGDGQTYTLPGEYTHVAPNGGLANPPLPEVRAAREKLLQGNHVDRVWTFFDNRK